MSLQTDTAKRYCITLKTLSLSHYHGKNIPEAIYIFLFLDCISSGYERILGYIRADPWLNNVFPGFRLQQYILKVHI